MAMGQIDAVNLRGFNGVIGNLRLRRRFAPLPVKPQSSAAKEKTLAFSYAFQCQCYYFLKGCAIPA